MSDTVPLVTRFFATISLVVLAATVLTAVLALACRRKDESGAARVLRDIRANAVKLAFAVAVGAGLGSLYLSEIAGYEPCPLCWLQRLCLVPLIVLLGVGVGNRWTRPSKAVWPFAVVGATIAAYHANSRPSPSRCPTARSAAANRAR